MENNNLKLLESMGILLRDEFPETTTYLGTENLMICGGDFPKGYVFIIENGENLSRSLSVHRPTGNDAGEGEQYRKVEERTLDNLTELVRYLEEEYWEG